MKTAIQCSHATPSWEEGAEFEPFDCPGARCDMSFASREALDAEKEKYTTKNSKTTFRVSI